MSDAGTDAHRPVVLLVGDDPDLRTVAGLQLQSDFDVIPVADGGECVEIAVSRSPDVILLDIMMPGIDGKAVMDALAHNPATRDIPVILLSGMVAVDDRVDGLERGAVDYITKPFEARELRARVGVAARIRARAEELAAQAGDRLTGLPAVASFRARLDEEIARTRRSASELSIALVDIDGLDEINRRHGRTVGDTVLRMVAEQMRATLRTADTLFRYGGDEFAVVLPDANVATAFLAAERLRAEILSLRLDDPVGLSIGIADHSSGRTAEELIAKAEIALFRAKESGGGRSWRADDPRRQSLSPVALSEGLTQREWDVLGQMARHRTEQEIARLLGITTGTVRSHKARIRRKLHVSPEVRLSEFVNANLRDLLGHADRMAEAR